MISRNKHLLIAKTCDLALSYLVANHLPAIIALNLLTIVAASGLPCTMLALRPLL
jgi:hypothetical protein